MRASHITPPLSITPIPKPHHHVTNPTTNPPPPKPPGNAAFGRLFRHSCEIMGDVLERKCLPALLFAGVISPDDRALWLHCMVRACFLRSGRRPRWLALIDPPPFQSTDPNVAALPTNT